MPASVTSFVSLMSLSSLVSVLVLASGFCHYAIASDPSSGCTLMNDTSVGR